MKIELVLQWTESTDEHLRSYVNGIPTGSGGTHENGLRAGLGKAVRNYIETHNLSPKGVTLTAEDIREGMTGILSVFLQEPQFQGQTKDRLNNPEVLSAVDGLVRPGLEHWLNNNQSIAEVDRRAHHPVGAGARSEPRGAGRSGPQRTDRRARQPARQAGRLHQSRLDHQRAVRRRRRFGGRVGEAGTRSRAPGDSAAARQGAQHRGRVDGEGAREQGARRSGDRARLRRRQELRHQPHALRQGDHPRRRRLGRPSHRDAAADVHLPAPAAVDDRRAASISRSRRCTASTSARTRTGRSTISTRIRSSRRPAAPRPRSRASRASAR